VTVPPPAQPVPLTVPPQVPAAESGHSTVIKQIPAPDTAPVKEP
jgi:hypothetical protein